MYRSATEMDQFTFIQSEDAVNSLCEVSCQCGTVTWVCSIECHNAKVGDSRQK